MIHQLLRAPDGAVRLMVQGLERIRLLDFVSRRTRTCMARVEPAPDDVSAGSRRRVCGEPCSISSGGWWR